MLVCKQIGFSVLKKGDSIEEHLFYYIHIVRVL